jgi:hypothetical protein
MLKKFRQSSRTQTNSDPFYLLSMLVSRINQYERHIPIKIFFLFNSFIRFIVENRKRSGLNCEFTCNKNY